MGNSVIAILYSKFSPFPLFIYYFSYIFQQTKLECLNGNQIQASLIFAGKAEAFLGGEGYSVDLQG
jgi:hypothetical protein